MNWLFKTFSFNLKTVDGETDYDIKIPGIVKNNNIYGIQFHPEKSGKTGLNILKAFGEMI